MIGWIKNLFRKEVISKESIQLPSLPESYILEVRDFALNGWELGETHGLPHWQRYIFLKSSRGTKVITMNIPMM